MIRQFDSVIVCYHPLLFFASLCYPLSSLHQSQPHLHLQWGILFTYKFRIGSGALSLHIQLLIPFSDSKGALEGSSFFILALRAIMVDSQRVQVEDFAGLLGLMCLLNSEKDHHSDAEPLLVPIQGLKDSPKRQE